MQFSELLTLDIDSFFVFARILLERIPFLLEPFYKGKVTKQDVKITDLKEHLDWFPKNRESVLDSAFYERMISFRKWFYEKLREPRNEIIVHPKRKLWRSEVSFNGQVNRVRYELQTIGEKKVCIRMKSTELPEISNLFKEIIEFLEFLNEYFSGILR